MAEAEWDRSVVGAARRWPVRIAVRHRIGALAVGDVAIAAAAASAHREHAFEACRYLVEEIKRRVPIWKRGCYAGGTGEWGDPTRAPATRMSSSDPPGDSMRSDDRSPAC